MKLLLISLGGVIGALLRYAVSGFTYRHAEGVFPWGTLAVNASGCLAIGFLWGVSERAILPPSFKPFVFVGILGAYTTFSTYALESFSLFRDGEIKLALINVLASNIGALVLVFAGFALSQYLLNFWK